MEDVVVMHNSQRIEDVIAANQADLAGAERRANREVEPRKFLPGLALGMMAALLALFFPHAGEVRGFDVLFFTELAQSRNIMRPEQIYTWLALTGGVLLTIGTIVSKSWIVAWANWAVAGIAWWYSIFAIWMRQSRPLTEPGDGPAFGLIMCSVGLLVLFITLSIMLFQRSPLQKALAQARRKQADKDEATRLAQQRLRTGLQPKPKAEIIDDRRRQAKQRRQR